MLLLRPHREPLLLAWPCEFPEPDDQPMLCKLAVIEAAEVEMAVEHMFEEVMAMDLGDLIRNIQPMRADVFPPAPVFLMDYVRVLR